MVVVFNCVSLFLRLIAAYTGFLIIPLGILPGEKWTVRGF